MRDVDFNSFKVHVEGVSDVNEKLRLHAKIFEYALHFYHVNNFDLKRAITHAMNIIYDGQSLYSNVNEFLNKGMKLEDISNELNTLELINTSKTSIESDAFRTLYDGILKSNLSYNLLKEVCRFLILLDCIVVGDIQNSEYIFPMFYILSLSFEKMLFKILPRVSQNTNKVPMSSRYYIISIFNSILDELKDENFQKHMEQVDESGSKRCIMENSNFVLSQTSLQRLIALITLKMTGHIMSTDLKKPFLRDGNELKLPQLFFPRNAASSTGFIEKYNKESDKKIEDKYKMHCLGGVLYKRSTIAEIDISYGMGPKHKVVDNRNFMYINGCILFNEDGSLMNTLGCSGVIRHDVTIKGSTGIIFELASNETFSYKRLMNIPFPFSFSAYEIDSTINPFTGTKSLLLDQSNFNISMYSSLENKELSNLANGYMDKTTLSPKLHIFHTGFSRFTAMTVGAVLPVKSSLNYVILPSVNEFECASIRKVKEALEKNIDTSYVIPLYNVIRIDLFIDYLITGIDSGYAGTINQIEKELKEYFGEELTTYMKDKVGNIFVDVK